MNILRVTVGYLHACAGVYMAHTSLTYQSSYVVWLAPIVAVSGSILAADICLSFYNGLRRTPDAAKVFDQNGGKGMMTHNAMYSPDPMVIEVKADKSHTLQSEGSIPTAYYGEIQLQQQWQQQQQQQQWQQQQQQQQWQPSGVRVLPVQPRP